MQRVLPPSALPASLLVTALLGACAGAPPTLPALGGHSFAITSRAAAQARFDEGLAWCNGFHHQEAIRCFDAALAADPDCAMALWGRAYAAGPHLNNMAMDEATARQAHADASRAAALAKTATPVEQALIAALQARYAVPAPADRAALDLAYAEAMRGVLAVHGGHADVMALTAEALMNLHPWDLYRQDGTPQPWTAEIVALLERLLEAHPRHPLGNHLYIHAVEASTAPERAVPAAERLRDLAPAVGHLVHMPAHVFQRVGRYEDAAEANRRGIAADLAIVARTGRTGFYEVYRAHNFHFLQFAAMSTGNQREAIAAADELVRELPMDVVQALPQFLEAFLGAPWHALVRFGRWQEILDRPAPPGWQKTATAMRHYARGLAFAALGRLPEARAEQAAFHAAAAEVPEDWLHGNNPTRTVLAVGASLLDGEIAFRAGEQDAAFAHLRVAVARDEALRYDEPWGWMMPPAHALGALLLESGRLAEAEQVYRADLRRHPENGWALHGLAECLARLGRQREAADAAGRFATAWRHADVAIKASCFCRR